MLTHFGRKLKQTNIFLILSTLILTVFCLIHILSLEPIKIEIKSLEVETIKGDLKEQVWKPPFTYQFSAEVTNPNKDFIAKDVSYVFEVKDDKNEIISKKEGRIDIGAEERKKIEEDLEIQNPGKNLDFRIINGIRWQRIIEGEE